MQLQSYGIKKISGLSVGVMTFLSIASVSSNVLNSSVTAGINSPYVYEGLSLVNDNEGVMCISSFSSMNELMMRSSEVVDFYVSRHKKKVELQITKTRKHISKFDFEEEYEEI